MTLVDTCVVNESNVKKCKICRKVSSNAKNIYNGRRLI